MSEQESGQVSEQEKEAIVQLKHYSNITAYWKQEEYTNSEVDSYIKTTLNYIEKLQKENEEYHRIKKELIRVNKKIYDVDTIDEFIKTIDELQKELEEKTTILMAGVDKVKQLEKKITELEKTIDLIIDDFKAENYFVGMTNKEVREYYKKRKELKE